MPDSSTPQSPSGLSEDELKSVEIGQRGLSEPEGVNTPPAPPSDRPEYVPEKFFKDGKVDVEALAKSYAELEKARSAPKAEDPPADAAAPAAIKPDGKIEKAPAATAEAAPNPLQAAMDAARAEWSESQQVSEETLATLEAAGIPKEVFNLYIEGLKATQAQTLDSIYSFADGEENYSAMATWAASALDDGELSAFNDALDNPQLRENAVRGLYARYSAAHPSEGNLVTPSGTASQAGDVYADRSELIADQKDPRYATDAKFRAEVTEKLQRSQRNGFQLVARPMFEREILTR